MTAAPSPTVTVAPDTMLPDLFRAHPAARRVFDRYGLKGCGGRQGPAETIRFFSRTHGVDEGRLLDEIRQSIRSGPSSEVRTAANVADTIYRRYFTAGVLVVRGTNSDEIWCSFLDISNGPLRP